jgi:hypothetical protein
MVAKHFGYSLKVKYYATYFWYMLNKDAILFKKVTKYAKNRKQKYKEQILTLANSVKIVNLLNNRNLFNLIKY